MKQYRVEVVIDDEVQCDNPQDTMDCIADVVATALRNYAFHPGALSVDPL